MSYSADPICKWKYWPWAFNGGSNPEIQQLAVDFVSFEVDVLHNSDRSPKTSSKLEHFVSNHKDYNALRNWKFSCKHQRDQWTDVRVPLFLQIWHQQTILFVRNPTKLHSKIHRNLQKRCSFQWTQDIESKSTFPTSYSVWEITNALREVSSPEHCNTFFGLDSFTAIKHVFVRFYETPSFHHFVLVLDHQFHMFIDAAHVFDLMAENPDSMKFIINERFLCNLLVLWNWF